MDPIQFDLLHRQTLAAEEAATAAKSQAETAKAALREQHDVNQHVKLAAWAAVSGLWLTTIGMLVAMARH